MKKFLALVLAMLMVVSAAATVSAFDDVAADDLYYDAITDLNEKGIITGWDEATFGPDGAVTRWQMALMLVKAITGKTNSADWEKGMARFTDVIDGQYNGAIYRAAALGIIEGVGDGLYEPERGVTYAEALTMIVRALNWDKQDKCLDKDGNVALEWPWDYIDIAEEKGLTEDVDVIDIDAPLTRAETAQVIFNLIYAPRYDVDNKKTADNTFAEEKFNVAGKKNTTYFILTETKKLGTTEIDADFKDEYVKITNYADQAKSYTVKATALGFKDAAEADAYYLYGVKAVNFDAEKETFASAEIVEPTVVNQTGIAYTAAKVAISGKTYYFLATGATPDALKNYVVINKSWSTTDEAAAADYAGAYQVSFFDYDGNGTFDVGYMDKIQMATYTDGKVKVDTNGTLISESDSKKVAKFDADLAKNDVFAFVSNATLNTVHVVEVSEKVTGKITKRATVKYTGYYDTDGNGKFDDKVAIDTITVDGKNYKVIDTNNGTVLAAGLTIANACNATTLDSTIELNKERTLTVLGDIVIKVEAPAAAEKVAKNYGIIASGLKEVGDYFFADMYIGGKKVSDAEIAKFAYKKTNDNDTTVDVAESTSYVALQNAIDKYKETYKVGQVVELAELEDGSYSIKTIALDTDANEGYLVKLGTTTGYETAGEYAGYKFKSAIGSKKADGTTYETATLNKYELRTDASTIFYFIETMTDTTKDKTIKTYIGKPEDDAVLPANVTVYTNKVGYAGDFKGIASVVFVELTEANNSGIKKFGNVFVAATESLNAVYVNKSLTFTEYEQVLGSTIGYTDSARKDKVYFKVTNDKLGINMKDGSIVTTLYAETLAAITGLVDVDAKGVVTVYDAAKHTKVKTLDATLNNTDLFETTYIKSSSAIDMTVDTAGAKPEAVTTLYVVDAGKMEVKNTVEDVNKLLPASPATDNVVYHTEKAYIVIVIK